MDRSAGESWKVKVRAALRGDRALTTRAATSLFRVTGGARTFFGLDANEGQRPHGASDSQIAIFESGEELISRIQDAITLRRSVLVTGPRGSGKTYCALEAIRRAEKSRVIAGHHFLQGNREIPRDYLSEDMLVIRELGEGNQRRPSPALLDAMLLRFPGSEADAMHDYRTKRFAEFKNEEGWKATEALIHLKEKDRFKAFPALTRVPESTLGKDVWKPDEWVVLFLDEINRFGDGFLDSLLSLTEERVIVRGGTKFHVPIVVVATANPPGYDITAKKLSPPLQARISRAYRVSQPTHETLVHLILPDLIERYKTNYRNAAAATQTRHVEVEVDEQLCQLVSGAALALWGIPDPRRKGIGFLTPQTQRLLADAARASADLEQDMRELGELVTFGPDARSVGDWIGCAMGLARRQPGPSHVARVTEEHLAACALESLGHKVRENFNEGADPAKVALKERLISRIVRAVLHHAGVRAVFQLPYDAALKTLAPPREVRQLWIDRLGHGHRGFVEALADPKGAPFAERSGALAPARFSVAEWSLIWSLAAETRRVAVDERAEARRQQLGARARRVALFIEASALTEVGARQQKLDLAQALANPDGRAREHLALAAALDQAAARLEALAIEHAQRLVDFDAHLARCLARSPDLQPWAQVLRRAGAAHHPWTLERFAAFVAAASGFVLALEGAPERRAGPLSHLSPALDDLAERLLVGRSTQTLQVVEARALLSTTISEAIARRLAELFGHERTGALGPFPTDASAALRAAFVDEVAFGTEKIVFAAAAVIDDWWGALKVRA